MAAPDDLRAPREPNIGNTDLWGVGMYIIYIYMKVLLFSFSRIPPYATIASSPVISKRSLFLFYILLGLYPFNEYLSIELIEIFSMCVAFMEHGSCMSSEFLRVTIQGNQQRPLAMVYVVPPPPPPIIPSQQSPTK